MRILGTHCQRCRTRTFGGYVFGSHWFSPGRFSAGRFSPNWPFALTVSTRPLLPFPLGVPVGTAAAASVASGPVAAGITAGRTGSGILALALLALALSLPLPIALAAIAPSVSVSSRVSGAGLALRARVAWAAHVAPLIAIAPVLLRRARLGRVQLPARWPRATPRSGTISTGTPMPTLLLPSVATAALTLLGSPRCWSLGR